MRIEGNCCEPRSACSGRGRRVDLRRAQARQPTLEVSSGCPTDVVDALDVPVMGPALVPDPSDGGRPRRPMKPRGTNDLIVRSSVP